MVARYSRHFIVSSLSLLYHRPLLSLPTLSMTGSPHPRLIFACRRRRSRSRKRPGGPAKGSSSSAARPSIRLWQGDFSSRKFCAIPLIGGGTLMEAPVQEQLDIAHEDYDAPGDKAELSAR